MAATIITKLLLQTEEYQKNMKAARAEMQQLEKGFDMAKSVVTKLAVSFGAVTTAGAAFQKIIGSSRTLTKAFNEDMTMGKAAVDTFFNAIAIGDFSNFTDTMNEAILSAKEFYAELGKLKTIKVFNNNDVLKINLEMAKARGVLMDKKSSASAKNQARAQLKDLNQQLLDTSKQLSDQATNTYYADLRKKMKSYGVSGSTGNLNKSIDKYVSSYSNYSSAVTKFNELNKKANSLMKKSLVYVSDTHGGFMTSYRMVATSASKAITDTVEFKTLRAIKEMGNSALEEAKGYEATALTSEIDAQNRINANLRKMGAGIGAGGNGGGKTESPAAFGSIDYMNNQISDLQKKFNAATDEGVREGFYKAMQDISNRLETMKISAADPLLKLKSQSNLEKTSTVSTGGGKTLADAQGEKISVPKIEPLIKSKDVKNQLNYNDALNGTFSMMLAISNVTSKGAAGWISYGVNAITALNQTYQALVKVIPALEIKAVAEGAGSAAETPIIGWITAIAAIGSMLAAFVSLPKYATGGIVGGSYTGDKNLVRANAGELILNKAQQNSIAYQLSSGQSVNVNVVGRISGKDIELVMDRRKRFKSNAL